MNKLNKNEETTNDEFVCTIHDENDGAHDDDEKDDDDDMNEAIEKRLETVDVSEHVDALMNGEGDLSEDFKRKICNSV